MLVTKHPSKALTSFCNGGIVGIFLLSGKMSIVLIFLNLLQVYSFQENIFEKSNEIVFLKLDLDT